MIDLSDFVDKLTALLGTPLMHAMAPAIIAGGFLMAVLPWIPTNARLARAVLALISGVLLLRYLGWRYEATLPPISEPVNWLVGWAFYIIEALGLTSALLSLLFLSGVRDRSAEADRHEGWERRDGEAPLIDVLICTVNEEQRILEHTILGAIGMDYPNFRVWVLDDGKRPWLKALSESLGVGYMTRPDNAGAKAGNINHALGVLRTLPEPPRFISILDADFVPTAHFLSRAMSLFHDSRVGIVQTPQHFINPDPIQTNLAIAGTWPDEQRYFFDIVMPAKDAWGAAFCCGTSSIIRCEALRKIGGIPTDSVTEDYLTTLRLKEIGYTTVYLNEALSFGLAPEGLKEYVTQRGRWALGFMQILRGPSGPLALNRLGFIDRLSLVEAFLNWSFVYLYKVAGIFVPALYLLFGVKAVEVHLFEMLAVFLPFYVVQTQMMAWVSHGRVVPILSDVAQMLTAPAALKAVFIGLFRRRGHKFQVTAKGGDRSVRFVEWPLLRNFLLLLVMATFAVEYAFALTDRYLLMNEGALALAWSWYNIVVLFLLCLACVEQPRLRQAGRFSSDEVASVFIDGRRRDVRMRDISVSGARFAGSAGAPAGTSVLVRIGRDSILARIVRSTKESFAVRFEPSLWARAALVRHIYSAMQEKAIRQVRTAPILRALARRILNNSRITTTQGGSAISQDDDPLEGANPFQFRHRLFQFGAGGKPVLLGLGERTRRLGARLGEIGGLRRIALVKPGIAEPSVKALNLLVKSCDQGFGILDLSADGRRLLAPPGGLAAAALRRPVRRRLAGAAIAIAVTAIAAVENIAAVIVEIAVIGRDRATGDQPQPVDGRFDQMAVMADEDDRAGELGQRPDQRLAAVDVEMVGRLVEDHQVGAAEGGEPEEQAGLLAAGKVGRLGVHLGAHESERAGAGAHLRFGCLRHQIADVVVGRPLRLQLVELVLGEIGDVQPVQAAEAAAHGRQPAADQLGQRRLAVAIGAEEPDAVVVVEAQVEAAQHRPVRLIADRHILHRHDRRRRRLGRRGEVEGHHGIVGKGRDRLQPLQHLQPRLRLARLRRLVAEAVDEGLQVAALVVLPGLELQLQRLALAALAVEGIVAAAIEGELALVEMDDGVDGTIEQVAVMADDDDAVGILGDVALQPQRAFEVEIVGRLVEKQQVGPREQGRGERHAHAPAAGEGRAGTLLRRLVEAEAGEDGGGTRLRRMGVRCRRALCGSRRCGAASCAVSASASSASRSRSAASTTAIRLSGPPGASCATWPIRAFLGRPMEPLSGPTSPEIRRKRVVLPAPLAPTRPALAPSGSATVAWSISRRWPIR